MGTEKLFRAIRLLLCTLRAKQGKCTVAQAARATRATLSLAFGRPQPEPARPAAHWDLLLQEARWLAEDFAQARMRLPLSQGAWLGANL